MPLLVNVCCYQQYSFSWFGLLNTGGPAHMTFFHLRMSKSHPQGKRY
jgi:hypothetical protein